jgi:hypothetical protein
VFKAKLCIDCGRQIVGERPVLNVAGFTDRRDYYHARCARRVKQLNRKLLREVKVNAGKQRGN